MAGAEAALEAAEMAVVAEPMVEAPMVVVAGWVDSEVALDMECERTDRNHRSDSPIQRRLRCSPSQQMDRCQSSVDRGSTAPLDCLCRRPAQGLVSKPTEIEAAVVAFVEMCWGLEAAAVAAERRLFHESHPLKIHLHKNIYFLL